MDLTEDQKDLIVTISNLRGGLRCNITKERKVGYLIRPELWFNDMNEPIARTLNAIGLEVRKTYSDPLDISSLLIAIEGLEELSPTTYGLKVVAITNGLIEQPTTHDEVIMVIEHIEELLNMNP